MTRTVVQTPEGDYRRLEQPLQAESALQWLDAFDDAIFNLLTCGEALCVESVLKVPAIYQWTDLASSAGPLSGFMDAIGGPSMKRRRKQSPA